MSVMGNCLSLQVIYFYFLFLGAIGLLSPLVTKVMAVSPREREKQVLDDILKGNYDNKIRPSGANGTVPTIVSVNLYVRSIATIDDMKMEYKVQLTFREQWLDERLKFSHLSAVEGIKYLTLTDSAKIWMPDLFFPNERQGSFHNIIMPNIYIRIFPNGEILYSLRISLTLACPMSFKLFPMDKQVCTLRMASYGWTTDDLIFNWKHKDPVQITPDLQLQQFILAEFRTDYCDSKTATGTYSCLLVDLEFKRVLSYYLIQIYFPCCMLIIVSWVSFWLDPNAVPARVGLGVTTLLSMLTQTASLNQKLPPVSYTKAYDVWTGVCLTFVFTALLEFALVNYVSRTDKVRTENKKKRAEIEQKEAEKFVGEKAWGNLGKEEQERIMKGIQQRTRGEKKRQVCSSSWLSRFQKRSKRIDIVSRIAFPIIFALFNIAYWAAYLDY